MKILALLSLSMMLVAGMSGAWSQAIVSQPATPGVATPAGPGNQSGDVPKPGSRPRLAESAAKAAEEGLAVRIKDIARFRGVRGNQIQGFGLVVGLEGTGDSKRTPMTATMLANLVKAAGNNIDPKLLDAKNVAVVSVTGELPPFASPGNALDVTVQSIGDAKSLQGGFLLQARLFAANDQERAVAVAMGAISIGGFNGGAGGTSVQKNHVNVGRIPGGGLVERVAPFQMVFEDNRMFLELDDGDLTTAARIVDELTKQFPEYLPRAVDGGTIELRLPSTVSPVMAMSRIESATVRAEIPASITVNERTGTIVASGNIKVGPALVVQGSLQLVIETEPVISQPAPFSNGSTVVTEQTRVAVDDAPAQASTIPAGATIDDLARLFKALKLTSREVISILQALRDQGALKARIRLQ